MTGAAERKHLYLVDGSGFIFRAYHAMPPLSTSTGIPVNAVAGFVQMLQRLLDDTDASHVAVILDAARRTFRNDLYPEYKAHRPPAPEDLIPQFALIREALVAMNVAWLEQDGFEADDLIATYARLGVEQGFEEVTVVSSDKDLMQLIGPKVALWDAMKNKVIGREEVIEKFGVPPEQVIEVQALIGDASDNVPGVPGIGVKTAAQLIGEFGSLENLLAKADTIPQPKRRQALLDNAELARISYRLVTLDAFVPDVPEIATFAKRAVDLPSFVAFLEKLEFRRLIAQLKARYPVLAGAMAEQTAADEAGKPAPVPTAETRYELIQTAERLGWWVAEATRRGVVAVDTETTGLNPFTSKLVGVSLALGLGEAAYIPLYHVSPDGEGDLLSPAKPPPPQIPLTEALALLGPLLADPSVLKVGHNIKYDMHILAGEGLTVSPIDDSMVLSYVLDGGSHGHGMDELADLHLAHKTIAFSDVCGSGKGQITFDRVPLDKALAYAAEDADITLRLHTLFRQRLVKERMVTVYETLDRPLIPVLSDMEALGIKVDAPFLATLSLDFGRRMEELEQEIYLLAGEEFNVGSPKQLGEILFDKMSLPGGKKGKTGAWGTPAEVLDDLAAQGHPLPVKVLEWRTIQKLKSTYSDSLVREINPATGRIHTNFAMTIASTGRLSSSDPNLQNIPIRTEEGRKIRRAFVAAPGHQLLSADYSQIELRLIAHVAGVKALTEAFHSGADIHAATASQVFGVPIAGMDPMLRRQAKAINFGIIYGSSAFGLARQLGIERGEAARFIEAYFARFPEILTYMERTKKEAHEFGYVRTPLGRKCFTPGIRDKNPNMRAFAERQAINAPIQGGAADIIKRAMIALPPALADAGLQTRMLLQVHDELVLEVPDAEAERAVVVVKSVMESAAVLDVPLIADAGLATSWAEAH